MKILLIKMSSMGDIFHTFPALTELKQQRPDIELDWVIEDSFKEIAGWHPGVRNIIPIQLRRWVKQRNKIAWQDFKKWYAAVRTEHYDMVIDAQGLLKSAVIAKCAKSNSIQGYDKRSVRETITHWFYSTDHYVDKNQHAVERTRQLFGSIFNYIPSPTLNFGINQNFSTVPPKNNQLIFIIGTSWTTKMWTTSEWQQLAHIALSAGFAVDIIWGSTEEQMIADAIIQACPQATRPAERLSITTIAEKLVAATGVIGLDTGFSHLAGALETPTIALYGATSPTKVGLIGPHTQNLQLAEPLPCMPCHKRYCKLLPEHSTATPPCMTGINADYVWQALQKKLTAH